MDDGGIGPSLVKETFRAKYGAYVTTAEALTQDWVARDLAADPTTLVRVPRVFDAWIIPKPLTGFIVMEYVAGGRFERLLADKGRLPEKEARWYFGQLIDAIAYCHAQVSALEPPCIIPPLLPQIC